MIRVEVPLPDRVYDVLIGPGARHELASLLPPDVKRAAIITQADIPYELDPGVEHRVFTVGVGEEHKTLGTVEALCRAFADWGLTRRDVVIGLGGGMVTDVAGFAAASYHRGLPVVHVSTSLLGMVDASIGGKTGVNLPEGKNLVGAFWQPHGVICDTETLASLPPEELRSGLGEVAKYHFLQSQTVGGDDLADLAGNLPAMVAKCVEIKAHVVAADEREGGLRAILNYGHTLAHAIETVGSYDLRHGEAVAVGLVYAAELARLLGRIDTDRVAEHRRIVGSYDLPVDLPAGMDHVRLLEQFSRDKKAIDGVTLMLDGADGVQPVVGIDQDVLSAALAEIDPEKTT